MKASLSVLCISLCVVLSQTAIAQESGLVEYFCPETADAWESSSGWHCGRGYVLDSSEDADCDEEVCCVYSGPVKYDVRYNDDYDMDWPVGEGRCVKGKANGTWTSKYFEQWDQEDSDWPHYELKYVATGRYNMGVPTGAHVVTYKSMVVEAACYKRIRHREDGETTYEAEVLWDFQITDDVPEEPEKPALEEFMDVDKPVFDEPDKPDKSDYDSGSDFREAKRDYNYEVREAKDLYKEEMSEYKQTYREMLPDAKSSLQDAMSEYKDSVKEYKSLMKELKSETAVLARLAKSCPKVTDDYCLLEGECTTTGMCAYHYDKNAEAGGCEAKKNAHCRNSDICKESGHCTASDGQCVASKEADCEASASCKTQGMCTMESNTCINACKGSPACETRGECSWVRRTGQICEPTSVEQCEHSSMCKEKGYCSQVTCENKDGCNALGRLPTDFGATRCAAGQESDCLGTTVCSNQGLCSLEKTSATCIALHDHLCKGSEVCKQDGRCSAKERVCVVAKDADCTATDHCVNQAKCSAAGEILPAAEKVGICAIGKDADCQKLRVCLQDGHCTYDKNTKTCVVGKNEDCASSLACWSAGRCSATGGKCVVGSAEDCAKVAGCYDGAPCHFAAGESKSPSCVPPAIEKLKKACEDDDWAACMHLGRRYQLGKGVKADLEEASDLYDDACDEDYGPACVFLGLNYLNGRGVSFDLDDALDAFEDACEFGEKQGCAAQAAMLSKRWGGKAKPGQVKMLIAKACDGTTQWLCNGPGVPVCKNERYGGTGCELLALFPRENTRENKAMAQEYLMKALALYERDCHAGYGSQCIAWALTHVQMNCVFPTRNNICEQAVNRGQKQNIMRIACKLGERAGCVAVGKTYKDVDEDEPAGPVLSCEDRACR